VDPHETQDLIDSIEVETRMAKKKLIRMLQRAVQSKKHYVDIDTNSIHH
jgi:hypothetical protein